MSTAPQVGKWRAQQAKSKDGFYTNGSSISSGDVGLFVTCDKGLEKNCLREIHDLLSQYIVTTEQSPSTNGVESNEVDIEESIAAELDSMKANTSDNGSISLITLDIPCVSFVKLPPSTDPVTVVRKICSDAAANPTQKRSRYIKRLTPMTVMRKTLNGGLEFLCNVVLAPHFHSGDATSRKYAIRPTVRNNNQLGRDEVIRIVAAQVGEQHKVDLTNYELLILVDVYRNVCGMSVVGRDYETLKRYNLAEIYDPTQLKPVSKEGLTEHEQVV